MSSTVSADIDVRGVLGIDPDVRKVFSNVEVSFGVDANCDDEQKDALVSASTKYSAVFEWCRTRPRSTLPARLDGSIPVAGRGAHGMPVDGHRFGDRR